MIIVKDRKVLNNLFFLLSVILLGILQGTALNSFRFFWVRPDLLLASVVIASLSLRMRWALAVAFLAGFLKDALGVYLFGINTLLFPVWAILIIKLKREISIENNYLIPLCIVLIISILNNLVIRLTFFSLGGLSLPAGIFIRTVIIESAYTALVFPLLSRAAKPVLAYKK